MQGPNGRPVKYIFVTGGVVSSLGKGLAAASIGRLLEDHGYTVALQMSTLRRQISDPADRTNPNVVKVVVDLKENALYFSRSPVPFARDAGQPLFKHVGLYAYRRGFVRTLASLPQTPLEITESLEQLRVLEHGHRIATVETQYDSIEVDTPEDLERVRRHMAVGTSA